MFTGARASTLTGKNSGRLSVHFFLFVKYADRLQKEGQGDESSITLQFAGFNRSAQYTRSLRKVKSFLCIF